METRTYAPSDCGICNKPISSISGVIYVDGRKYHEGKCCERLLMVKAAANDNQTAPASRIEVEAAQTMSDLETALIVTMEAIVRLHDPSHDYLNECDCADAVAFRQGDATLARHGIRYATSHVAGK